MPARAGDPPVDHAPAATRRAGAGLDRALLEKTLARAAELPSLHALLVGQDGAELVARVFRGPGLDRLVNVKSVSKSIIAALVGSAIARGVLAGVDQRVAPLLHDLVPATADPRIGAITIDHLLTMRAGLERTSGRNYGRWVNSADWLRYALSRPFVDEPGGRMLYSTGSYHLLSAVLTRAAGRSTLALARDWLGDPLEIAIPPWTRDPQGFYLGGNNMALAPRALLRFGELYRLGGAWRGRHVLPGSWIEASWTPRVRSPFTGHTYGYGWFVAKARGHLVAYAWGYGGQMVYVVPDLALTVVMTSDPDSAERSRRRVLLLAS
ncbi:MAG: 6-aminohexanoate hydrolase [Geminicoccaceae bacterium]|nr:6-aminohexanoate hydrolase [Geminicoccaceae bacterium]